MDISLNLSLNLDFKIYCSLQTFLQFWIDNLINFFFLPLKWKTKTFVVSEQFSHSFLSVITYFWFFFTDHGGISAELIIITKTSLLKELLHMTVHRKVKVRYEHIRVARITLIFEYFTAKLCQMLFAISKLNLSCIKWWKFL